MRLHQSQPAAIKKIRDQPRRTVDVRQHRTHFGSAQHHRQPLRARRSRHVVEPRQFNAKHLPIKKQQCLERLILRRRTDLAVDGQMRQERLDLRRPHVARMLSVMEFDIPPHPLQIGLFGSKRQMTGAHPFARHLEQTAALRHIIPRGVLRDTPPIRPQGNQEDVSRSNGISTAFDAIVRLFGSANHSSN
jgi:hypothetical protein